MTEDKTMWLKRKEFIQRYTVDSIPDDKINYTFSIPDFFPFYNWWSDEKKSRTEYFKLMKQYFAEMGQFIIDNPEYDIEPMNKIGKIGIRRYKTNLQCPLSKHRESRRREVRNALPGRVIKLGEISGLGWSYQFRWFRKFPTAWLPNVHLYWAHPVDSLSKKLKQKKWSFLNKLGVYEPKILEV